MNMSAKEVALFTAGAIAGAAVLVAANEKYNVIELAKEQIKKLKPKPAGNRMQCSITGGEATGTASACAGCPNQKACASGETPPVDPSILQVQEKLADVKHKILVLSGKGGVGKSTVSAQLSFGLSERDRMVGAMDTDITGPSLPLMLGINDAEVHQTSDGWTPVPVDANISVISIAFMLQSKNDAVIWRSAKKNGLIRQFLTGVNWGPLDYLVIDTPPGTSDEHLSVVNYMEKAGISGAVLVTTPQEASLQDVRREIDFCNKTNIKIFGVIENMAGNVFVPTTGGAKAMCAELDVPFLGSIPMHQNIAICGDNGIPCRPPADAPPGPGRDVAQALSKIVDKLIQVVETGSLLSAEAPEFIPSAPVSRSTSPVAKQKRAHANKQGGKNSSKGNKRSGKGKGKSGKK